MTPRGQGRAGVDPALALLDIEDSYRTSKHFAHLRSEGIRLVPALGDPEAGLMIIAEAPNAADNGACQPFAGRMRPLLTSLLEQFTGVDLSQVYMTYLVKYRTPGNRPPTPKEAIRSLKFLRKEWDVVRPLVTVALGDTVQAALGAEGLSHGVLTPWWYNDQTDTQHRLAALRHPSFGLRNKQARRWIEKEWHLLGEEIGEFVPQLRKEHHNGTKAR